MQLTGSSYFCGVPVFSLGDLHLMGQAVIGIILKCLSLSLYEQDQILPTNTTSYHQGRKK